MQHLDTDIDIALDAPVPVRPGLLHYLARCAFVGALLGVFIGAYAGRITLDGKALPAVFALVAILGAVVLATRPASN